MKIVNVVKSIVLLLSLSLVACNIQSESGYSLMMTSRSSPNYISYHSYSIEMVNAPEFLREHIIREFDTAFEEHGLTRNDSESDLRVRFIYKYIRLDAVQGDIDLVSEEEAIESDVHYKEVISIDLFETDTGYHIRGGEISRILSISPLDYGIEERNKNDLLSAFRRFLTAVLSS